MLALGSGGEIVIEFADNAVIDGPGPDFLVFENAFLGGAAIPTASMQSWARSASATMANRG